MTDVQPDYFAVPDPLDPEKLSYWYRPKRGRKAGKLQPWPPRRNDWGRLTLGALQGMPSYQREDFQVRFWAQVREARRSVNHQIDTDPIGCAARFAAAQSICCCCGKGLTDERSKAYGIGPDCRSGIEPEVLATLIERMTVAHAAGRVSWKRNSHDEPELFA